MLRSGLFFVLAMGLHGQEYTNAIPLITQQPASQITYVGGSFSFSVNVPYGYNASYQWYLNGVAVPNQTGYSYSSYGDATAQMAGSYTVKVSNNFGSVTSDAATLTVSPTALPTIIDQPQSELVPAGGEINLQVSAESLGGNASYQWYLGTTALLGATSSEYNLYNATSGYSGSYTVQVTNSAGTVTSDVATVAVGSAIAPVITVPPASQTVLNGGSASLQVTATGSPPLSYQWYLNGSAIPGATNSYYSFYSATSANSGSYTVQVSNNAVSNPSVTSSAATVTVSDPVAPTISVQPAGQSLTPGSYESISVNASGTPNLQYQWYLGSVAIPNATQSYLYFYPYSSANAGSYTVMVSNAQGSVTSDPAVIATAVAAGNTPQITQQPIGQTVATGAGLNLSVTASCAEAFTYQWTLNGNNITGATSAGYTVASASLSDAGPYQCVCTSAAGSASSSTATVAVLAATVPVFVIQPVAVTLNPGDTLQLTGTASGMPTPTYQWYKDTVALPNATSQSYYASNASSVFAGDYKLVATNSAGAASVTVHVSLNSTTAPTILGQPTSASYDPNTEYSSWVYFDPTLGGSAPTSIQWYLNNQAIPNATSLDFTLYDPTSANVGTYTFTATNSAGSVTSAAIPFTIDTLAAPVITGNPAGGTIDTSSYEELGVQTELQGPYTYQWSLNGTPIANADNSYLYLFYPTDAAAGDYTVTVSDSAGSVTSAAADIRVMDPPAISAQPQNVSVNQGGSASFTVAVSNPASLVYQWYLNGSAVSNGTNVSGATSATLNLSDVSPSAGQLVYTCEIASYAGTATTSGATLTVNAATAPSFTTAPSGSGVPPGSSVTLTGNASGSPAPTYQWYFNSTLIAGATNDSYTIAAFSSANVGTYTIEATNTGGTSSASASLTLDSLPVFNTNPASQTVVQGSGVTFTAAATGAPAPTFQWYLNGVAITGATSATYSIANAQSANAGNYVVNATNALGAVASAIAVLNVGPALAFTTQPLNATVTLGANYALVADAVGTPSPTYQWYFNGNAIGGATSATFALNSAQVSNSGSYTVIASNSIGSVLSNAAIILVDGTAGGPTLALQPTAENVVAGDAVTFSVSLGGNVSAHVHPDATSGGATYQWYLNGVAMLNATGPTLLVTNVSAANVGSYSCLVTTASGAVMSNPAALRLDSGGTVPGHLVNISVLAKLAAGANNDVTMGFAAGGGTSPIGEPLLVRVTGPALTAFNVSNVVEDPQLAVFNNAQTKIATNAGWASTAANESEVTTLDPLVGAFALTDPLSNDSALPITLMGGTYTVQASSRSGAAGTLLAEVYDATLQFSAGYTPRLLNISCLQNLAAGTTTTVGFSISGQSNRTVLIRADGPSLSGFGVTNVMPDPTLTLYTGQTVIGGNQGWQGDATIKAAAASVYAFALASDSSNDSAILVTLAPGTYTVQTSSASGAGGNDLLEVYEVP